MSSKCFLLALTIGLGLSLSACAGEQGGDLDDGEGEGAETPELDADTPEMKPMDGGTGVNGGAPAADCIKGMVYAMTWYQGWDPNTTPFSMWGFSSNSYNPALDWVRCDGTIQNPGNAAYPSPKITSRQDALKEMAWAGSHSTHGITASPSTHWGNGWFTQSWAAAPISAADADLLGGLIASKWNMTTVQIRVEADGLVGPATTTGADLSTYSLQESMVVFDPMANNPWYPSESTVWKPELYMFVADAFKNACPDWDFWFDQRMCHSGVCGVTYRPESSVGTYCKQEDGVTPATGIADAHRCVGGLRPVKVWVEPDYIMTNMMCNPIN